MFDIRTNHVTNNLVNSYHPSLTRVQLLITKMDYSSCPRVMITLAVKSYFPYLLEKGFLGKSRLESLQDTFRLRKPLLLTATRRVFALIFNRIRLCLNPPSNPPTDIFTLSLWQSRYDVAKRGMPKACKF